MENKIKSEQLLTKEESEKCAKIADMNVKDSARAQTLLLLDKGKSQKQAALETGLSPGQVKYLLQQFRQKRLDIFSQMPVPEAVIEDSSEETTKEAVIDKAPKPPKKESSTKKKAKKESRKQKKKNKKKSESKKKKKDKKKKKKELTKKKTDRKKSKKKNDKKKGASKKNK